MIDETSRHQIESIEGNARINSSIERLKVKLKNFIVINRHGQLIGHVEDLILEPNRQINFVVSQNYSDQSPRLFLLVSKLVQKVDPSNQSVIVDINKAEIEHFPEYTTKETPGMETSDISDSSRSAPKPVNEGTSEDSDMYSVATPAADADIFSIDLDDTSTDIELSSVQEQDMTLDSDVYPTATPAADDDIFNDIFNLGLDDTSTYDVALANVQGQEQDITPDKVYPIANSDISIADAVDITSSDVSSAGVQEQDVMSDINVYPLADAGFFEIDLDDTSNSDVGSSGVQEQPQERTIELTNNPEVLEEEIIRLLGERLVVDRGKRKVGEVIVRKEIETRMVQVPVRREKLIVEQISPERKQLAEIDLGLAEISAVELPEAKVTGTKLDPNLSNELTVKGEFNSPKIASLLLNAIALERRQGCKKVRVEIVVEDAERQKTYQEWADRCSSGKLPDPKL